MDEFWFHIFCLSERRRCGNWKKIQKISRLNFERVWEDGNAKFLNEKLSNDELHGIIDQPKSSIVLHSVNIPCHNVSFRINFLDYVMTVILAFQLKFTDSMLTCVGERLLAFLMSLRNKYHVDQHEISVHDKLKDYAKLLFKNRIQRTVKNSNKILLVTFFIIEKCSQISTSLIHASDFKQNSHVIWHAFIAIKM